MRLTADDGELTTSDDVTVTVNAVVVNQSPVVNAGTDDVIFVSETTSLDATVSDDGLPGSVATIWSVVSGSGDVTFGDASSIDTTAGFSAAGDLRPATDGG